LTIVACGRTLILPQRGQATTKKLAHGMELSRNFFISFISVRVHFREPDFFAFFAKISFVIHDFRLKIKNWEFK
jgi:hypothetical protein